MYNEMLRRAGNEANNLNNKDDEHPISVVMDKTIIVDKLVQWDARRSGYTFPCFNME